MPSRASISGEIQLLCVMSVVVSSIVGFLTLDYYAFYYPIMEFFVVLLIAPFVSGWVWYRRSDIEENLLLLSTTIFILVILCRFVWLAIVFTSFGSLSDLPLPRLLFDEWMYSQVATAATIAAGFYVWELRKRQR